MDILKAELERKRKQIEQLGSNQNHGKKKYLRRVELEALQEQERNRLEAEKQKKSIHAQKLKNKQSSAQQDAQLTGSKKQGQDEDEDEDNIKIAPQELTKRLRVRGEPIRLFGETEKERLRRLRILEAQEERTEGQRNDFRKAMQSTDTQAVLELLKKNHEDENHGDQADGDEMNGIGSTAADGSSRKSKKDDLLASIDTSIISYKLFQEDPDKTRMLIHVYFKRLLKDWENWLNERPDDIKQSTQGKLQTATQKQSVEYMRPFFKRLKKGVVEEDVVARIADICEFMQKREYINANDVYLRLSIGNAPWPIGVTMVGIHERSAREKIHSNQVAHVLNDETQRKWIQSIKRLMTFAQTKYPPADLTQKVG